jgi:hypothetical protein
VHRADNLTTFMCPKGPSRPVVGKLYFTSKMLSVITDSIEQIRFEKLVVSQPIKKFPTFCATQML